MRVCLGFLEFGFRNSFVIRHSSFVIHLMKILVANIGSTSLKWRLFDCSNGGGRPFNKGRFERVSDYPKAIDDCLGQLRDASVITSERDLAPVGFKTVIARDVTGCVRLDERGLGAMRSA